VAGLLCNSCAVIFPQPAFSPDQERAFLSAHSVRGGWQGRLAVADIGGHGGIDQRRRRALFQRLGGGVELFCLAFGHAAGAGIAVA